jgi:hypothetical protein
MLLIFHVAGAQAKRFGDANGFFFVGITHNDVLWPLKRPAAGPVVLGSRVGF